MFCHVSHYLCSVPYIGTCSFLTGEFPMPQIYIKHSYYHVIPLCIMARTLCLAIFLHIKSFTERCTYPQSLKKKKNVLNRTLAPVNFVLSHKVWNHKLPWWQSLHKWTFCACDLLSAEGFFQNELFAWFGCWGH